jgi:thymidylate synthase
MKPYIELGQKLLQQGTSVLTRVQEQQTQLIGETFRWNMREGFPILTMRHVAAKPIFAEALWSLSGSDNIKGMMNQGVMTYAELARVDTSSLGPIMSKQWRSWDQYVQKEKAGVAEAMPFDQITEALHKITSGEIENIVVSGWNVAQLNQAEIIPPAVSFQLVPSPAGLSMIVNLRNVEIISELVVQAVLYGSILTVLSKLVNMGPHELIFIIGRVYVMDFNRGKLESILNNPETPAPTLVLSDKNKLEDFQVNDFSLQDYQSTKQIKIPLPSEAFKARFVV